MWPLLFQLEKLLKHHICPYTCHINMTSHRSNEGLLASLSSMRTTESAHLVQAALTSETHSLLTYVQQQDVQHAVFQPCL